MPSLLSFDNAAADKLVESVSSVQQDEAILKLWAKGASPNDIGQLVGHYNASIDRRDRDGLAVWGEMGYLNDLSMVALIPTEELTDRIISVVRIFTNPLVEPRPNVEPYANVQPYPSVETPQPNVERESADEGTTPHPQTSKRPRGQRKGTRRSGCPYNDWKCKPHEASVRKYWDSKKGFFDHFKAHLEKCRDGTRWKCPLSGCKHPSFGGDGSDLLEHLWLDHWGPEKPAQ